MLTLTDLTSSGPHRFAVFASDLEMFRKGFPRHAPTVLGNGEDFVFTYYSRDNDGDVTSAHYRQANGTLDLVVYND